MKRELERRILSFKPQIRAAATEGEMPTIEGYASVFNSLSENLGGFRERIAPGAFKRALAAETLDVRALINHDGNLVMARSKSGTLSLEEDDRGLKVSIKPPKTTYARDLVESLERGDIDQMSFAFIVAEEGDTVTREEVGIVRDVTDIEELLDVSIVTYPAYTETQVQVSLRSLERAKALEDPEPAPATEVERKAEAWKRAAAAFGVELRDASFQDKIAACWDALYALLGYPWSEDGSGWWIVAVFQARVVVQTGPGRYVAYSVAFDEQNVATLADPTAVEVQYVPIASPSPEPRGIPIETLRLRNDLQLK